MRAGVLALLAAAVLAACGPPPGTPKRANSSKVAEGNPQAAMLWPSLLQHCLRTPECDPMSKFSEGAGEASGIEGSAMWFAVTDAGGGARVLVSFNGYRGQGGDAGRPLAPSETPRNLRGRRDNRSWVTIEYGVAGDAPVARSVRVRSPHVVLAGAGEANGVRRQARTTAELAASYRWPEGQTGARLDLAARTEAGGPASALVLHATGADAGALLDDREMLKLPSAPWLYDVTLDLEKAPGAADALLSAVAREEPLTFRIASPSGVILQDAVYTDGLDDALAAARAALADPAIAQPLTERCLPFIGADPDTPFETVFAGASPAARTCDSRTPEQRARDAAK